MANIWPAIFHGEYITVLPLFSASFPFGKKLFGSLMNVIGQNSCTKVSEKYPNRREIGLKCNYTENTQDFEKQGPMPVLVITVGS